MLLETDAMTGLKNIACSAEHMCEKPDCSRGEHAKVVIEPGPVSGEAFLLLQSCLKALMAVQKGQACSWRDGVDMRTRETMVKRVTSLGQARRDFCLALLLTCSCFTLSRWSTHGGA